LKERERDDRDDEIARLKSKVGEITMDNELLNAKIAALEGKRPLAHRRSRRCARRCNRLFGISGCAPFLTYRLPVIIDIAWRLRPLV